jgi:hypothetical protein
MRRSRARCRVWFGHVGVIVYCSAADVERAVIAARRHGGGALVLPAGRTRLEARSDDFIRVEVVEG